MDMLSVFTIIGVVATIVGVLAAIIVPIALYLWGARRPVVHFDGEGKLSRCLTNPAFRSCSKSP